MKSIFLAVVLMILSILSFAQTQEKPKDLINWLSFEEAMEKHKAEPKTVFIDMYTDWCGWCTKMDLETFQHPDIASFINTHFYPVKFNAERTDTVFYEGKAYVNLNTGRRSSHQLAQLLMNGRMSYPTIVYIDFENNINAVPGYMDVKSIEPLLIYFSERINKTSDYTDFRQDFTNTFMPDSTSKTNGNINWVNLDLALEKIEENPKKLFLFINSDFNNSSKIMLASTLRHPVIADIINENFYAVKINYDYADTIVLGGNTFINENLAPSYPHQLVVALLQPDIKLPSIAFFSEELGLIFPLKAYHPAKALERYLEFIIQDLYKTGGDWQKFNEDFKSKL